MTEDGVQRDLGRMEAQIESLTQSVEEMKKELKAINSTLSEARGGWRLMVLLGGASATLGGLLVKFLPYFGGR